MADVTPRHVALFLRHGSWMRAAAFALRCEQNLNTKAGADFLSTLETSARLMRTDLVSAAASSGSKPLFAIAQSDTLRVYVDVPQSEAVNIRDGQTAVINVSERLGRNYTGTITRNASALNDAARTMRTEVQVENRDASLLPGMYAQVHFTLSQQRASLMIPASSLSLMPSRNSRCTCR